jgi:hypothetical protein
MTQTRGTFPELNTNYRKPKGIKPLPIQRFFGAPAAPRVPSIPKPRLRVKKGR